MTGDATNTVRKSAISTLEPPHRLPIVKAVTNILATEIAAETYAQIVDGLPLAKTYLEAYSDPLFSKEEHPASRHTELCPGVLEELAEIWESFDVEELHFNSRVSAQLIVSVG